MDDDNKIAFPPSVTTVQQQSTKAVWVSRALFVLSLLIGVAFAYLYGQSSRLTSIETDVEQLQAEALSLHKQAVVNRFESIDNPSKISIVFRQRLLQLSNHQAGGELKTELNKLTLQGSQYAEQLDIALMSHDAFSNIALTLIDAQKANQSPELESLYHQLTLDLLSLLSQEQTNNDAVLEELNRSLLSIDTQQQQLSPELQVQAKFVIKSILPMLSRYVQYLQAVQNIHLTPFDDTYNSVLHKTKEIRSQYEFGQLFLMVVLVIIVAISTWLNLLFKLLPNKALAVKAESARKKEVQGSNTQHQPDNIVSGKTTASTPTDTGQVSPAQSDSSKPLIRQNEPELSTPAHQSIDDTETQAGHIELDASSNTEKSISASPALSSIELFDLRHILHCMDEDLDSVIMLLEIFVQEHGSDGIYFRLALEDGRIDDAARIVHSLKGVAGSIGSNALKNIAERLELAIKKEDMIVESDSAELDTILKGVVKTVQVYLETQGVTVAVKKFEPENEKSKPEEGSVEFDVACSENTLMNDQVADNGAAGLSENKVTIQQELTPRDCDTAAEGRQEPDAKRSSLIDIKYMMTTMDDDADSVKMLLEIFIDEHVNDGKKLLQQVHNSTEISEDAIRIVHSIKGVSSSLGAHPLRVLAGDIETRFKQGQPVSDADYRAFDLLLTDTISAATYYLEAENLAVYDEGVA
ncbi:Hpt domain-containing protein [Photobacterium sanguinicancri]|uniref:Hpt domain-containing protein n=1 Tax=Photobacterium sanguinicancri TaxID=875932 RepID=UPI0021C2EB3E|nr:Hpt domain-containing protein [Photobacterium sanguinicancri]